MTNYLVAIEVKKVLAHQDPDQAKIGPWDSNDPDRSEPPQGWTAIDLGALIVHIPNDVELRMEVREEDNAVLGIEIEGKDLVMQLMAYAGPRSSDMWDEVRGEIAESIAAEGGTFSDRQCGARTHLIAVLKDGSKSVNARFIGYDGPRWFVRAVISGARAHDDSAIGGLQEIVNNVVVIRDDLARPMQEPLDLSLPSGPAQVL